MIELTRGVTVEVKVTEYDVRCETALSRACRIAASVVLYALDRRYCAITGTMLTTDTTDTTMEIASTTITSSKLKPLALCLPRTVFVFRLFINICRTCGFHHVKKSLKRISNKKSCNYESRQPISSLTISGAHVSIPVD